VSVFSGNKTSVIDGPFAETKELIAGFWIINVKSRQEAVDWARKVPAPHGSNEESEIEIRQFFELEDFAPSEANRPPQGSWQETRGRQTIAAV